MSRAICSPLNAAYFSDKKTVFQNFSVRSDQPEDKQQGQLIKEEAKFGVNVHPSSFDQESITNSIDPMTNLKKEQNLEYKETPKDGKHDPTTYHVMKSLKPFKDRSNDISKEYGVRVKGLEPTRFGDWERRGRCTDF